MKKLLLLPILLVAVLAFTNPSEAKFREHVRQKQGIAGSLGLAVADLFSGGQGGVQRDNYLVASRYFIGGDGMIPREDLAWGVAGMFFDAKK